MIDIKLIRENPQLIEHSIKSRELDVDLNDIIKKQNNFKKSKQSLDELRRKRNDFSKQINDLKKKKKKVDAIIKKSRENVKKIKETETKLRKMEEEYKRLLYCIPNILDKNVPIGKKDRVDYESKIKKPNFNFKAKTNWELLTDLGLADFKRGIKASGDRGWVLIGDAAQLSRAITNFGLDYWRGKGYSEMIPPFFVNEKNLYITGHYPGGEKEVYKTEDGKVFVATAEISVMAVFANDEFNKKDLPKKIVSYTPCFRREAGSHADDKGLYRTHQFDKIELTHITTKEKEPKEYEQIFEDLKEFYTKLEIPHRIITHRANDMPNKATIEKDVEVWLAAEKRWGEAGSIGMTSDFQCRRGNIKYEGEGGKKFAHSIYATGCVANRILIAILNNYQTKDGSIEIPKVLQPYMNGKKLIKKQ